MEVRHCPSCGSEDVSTSRSSFEYGGSTRWSCSSCGWRYKKGRGMGTGTGNSGTHPRDVEMDDQTALDGAKSWRSDNGQGVWCSDCEVCALPEYCGCVGETHTGFCEGCARYSDHNTDEMLGVNKYSGRYNTKETFQCDVCGENKAEFKIV